MAVTTSPSMIFQLFLLMGHQASTADAVLERFAAAHKVMPTFEAKVKASVGGAPAVACTIRARGVDQVFFRMSEGSHFYAAKIDDGMVLEVDSPSKQYDYRQFMQFGMLSSRISRGAMYFPEWIGIGDLRKAFGKDWQSKGQETISGAKCDRIYAKLGDKQSGQELEFSIDAAGMPRKVGITRWSRERSIVRYWTLESLTVSKSLPDALFALNVPSGFSAYALDYTPGGVTVGQSFPRSGLVDDQGRTVTIPIGKPTLVAVLDEESVPSKRAYDLVRSLSVPAFFISADPSSASVRYLRNPDGKLLAALDVQGTPTIYALDAKGVVAGMWMGFDSSQAAKLSADIKSVLTEGE